MTLPYERVNSVNRTRQFLRSLLDPKETPRIPKQIRQQAASLLRHFPNEYDMGRACEPINENHEPVFGKDPWQTKTDVVS
jgi:hypothetical protein